MSISRSHSLPTSDLALLVQLEPQVAGHEDGELRQALAGRRFDELQQLEAAGHGTQRAAGHRQLTVRVENQEVLQ